MAEPLVCSLQAIKSNSRRSRHFLHPGLLPCPVFQNAASRVAERSSLCSAISQRGHTTPLLPPPPPPPPTGVGAPPRVNYVSFHASFIWFSDGSSMASWISGGYANNNRTVVSTKFTAAELEDILFYRKSQDSPDPVAEAGWQIVLDTAAAAVRLTLECEAMRWIYNAQFQIGSPPDSYGLVLLQHWGTNTAEKRANAAQTRGDIKIAARDGSLFFDIPPPIVTFSGGRAIISRPGSQGRIYHTFGIFADPKSDELNPIYTSLSPGVADPLIPSGETITVRVYGPDIDGLPAWSAPIISQAP